MFAEQIKTILKEQNKTVTWLAVELKTSEANLAAKLRRDNFRESEMRTIAEILGLSFRVDLGQENHTAKHKTPVPVPTPPPEPAPTPAPVPQTPPPYYVDYTKEQVQQWKRYIGTDSAPMPPDSPDFKLFKQFLDDFEHKRTITFKEG